MSAARLFADTLPGLDGWCQRWRERTPRWRHLHQGGFDARRYAVTVLDEATARAFCTAHHYSSAWPAARLRYGLVDLRDCGEHVGAAGAVPVAGGTLVGVAVLGVPMHVGVLSGPFPALEPYLESLELSRLVLLDAVAANGESWFCARAFRLAAEAGVRGLIAFSDPMPRWRATTGEPVLIMPGHCGYVYQGLGSAYLGRATPRTLTMLPDATVLTARAVAKVRNAEPGHLGVVARLVRLGASPLGDGQDRAGWLRQALAEVGARQVRHRGNHRFAFALGRTRAERSRTTIAGPAYPYPKLPDPHPGWLS